MKQFELIILTTKVQGLKEFLADGLYYPITLQAPNPKQSKHAHCIWPGDLEVGCVVQKNIVDYSTVIDDNGFYYEIIDIHEGIITLRNLYDLDDVVETYDNEMVGLYSVLALPYDPPKDDTQKPTAPNLPSKVRTVWVKPEVTGNDSYMPRKVISELCNGELLATVTPSIFTRLTDAIKDKKPLPGGISLYIYRRSDVRKDKPNN